VLAAFLINVAAVLSAQSAGAFYFSFVSPTRIGEPIPCPPTIACEPYTLVNVIRSGGTTGAVTVDLVIGGGTATPDLDYDVANGLDTPQTGPSTYTVKFQDGDAGPHNVFVVPHRDQLIEGDETVPLRLASPTGGAALGSPTTATIVIFDTTTDPRSQGVPTLSASGLGVLGLAMLGAGLFAMRSQS